MIRMIRMIRMNQLSHAVTALAAATLAGHAHGGGCQPPPNETCGGQIVFTTAQLPFEDDGLIGCVNNVVDKPYWDIFYRYDCAITADHTFEMCDSAQDAYIRIYVNGCGWADGQEFAVGDDECPGSPPNADPVITVPLVAGTPYWIELGTWRPDQPWGAPNIPFRFLVTVEGCEGDTDGDMTVGILDLLGLLAAWGSDDPVFDLDGDGTVGIADFLALLAAWGPCL